MNERKVASAIRYLVNPRGLPFQYARVLQEGLLVPVICMAVRKNKKV